MSEALTGSLWHESPQKHLFDAQILALFGQSALLLARMAAVSLYVEGKMPFLQERVGYEGKPFLLPKLQTLAMADLPYGKHLSNNISMHAELIRYLALDEFIGLTIVSGNPDNPGPLSVVGRRPLMPDTLAHMKLIVPEHFDQWYEKIYCRMRPGVFGVFGSLQALRYRPGSKAYYMASMASDKWYYENGSEVVDWRILHVTAVVGWARLQQYITPRKSLTTPIDMTLF